MNKSNILAKFKKYYLGRFKAIKRIELGDYERIGTSLSVGLTRLIPYHFCDFFEKRR